MKVSAARQNPIARLSQPKNNKAEILFTLIAKGNVSIRDFGYMSGFRTRLSEISRKDNINLRSENLKGTNKFGNTYVYVNHLLPEEEKETAIELYHKINA